MTKRSSQNKDILLVTVSEVARPYMMGVATLKAYLKTKHVEAKCVDPVNQYMEQLDSLPESTFLEKYNPDASIFIDEKNKTGHTVPTSEHEKGIAKELSNYIEKFNPRFLGFSLIAGNFYLTFLLAKYVKKHFPKLPIILGGCAMADQLPFDFEKLEFIDYFVFGDGEENLVNILSKSNSELLKENHMGLSFKHKPSPLSLSKTHSNKEVYFSKNQDIFYYPDFTDFENYNYYKTFFKNNQPLTLSRGCPYRCTFCNVKQFSYRYSFNPVDLCIKEIKKYTDSGVSRFIVVDSIINGNPKWLKEFCHAIIKNKLQIEWVASFRLQSIMKHLDYFKMITDAGCESMIIGLESASHNVLKDMKKYFNLDSINQIFDQIREIKKTRPIRIYLQLIIGYPTESDEDFKETLNFVFKHMDVIDEIASASVFMMLDDFKAAYEKKNDNLIYHYSPMDWATDKSTPENRLERAVKLENLFKKLKIPYEMYYQERIEKVVSDSKPLDPAS